MSDPIMQGARQGCQFKTSIPTTGDSFTTNQDLLTYEIRFQIPGGTGQLDAETVRLFAEGQDWFGGQAVTLTMLDHVTRDAIPGAGNRVVFRLAGDLPAIEFNASNPIKVVPSVAMDVVIFSRPAVRDGTGRIVNR